MLKPDKFTLRVYGILINADKKVLLTNEKIKGITIKKFPGGGLEPGESLPGCLEREFLEETGILIHVKDHFYTTDIFVQSRFDPAQQVIAIYYLVDGISPIASIEQSIHDFEGSPNYIQPYWLNLGDIEEEMFSFETDKIVVAKLKKKISS